MSTKESNIFVAVSFQRLWEFTMTMLVNAFVGSVFQGVV